MHVIGLRSVFVFRYWLAICYFILSGIGYVLCAFQLISCICCWHFLK